MVNNVVCGTNIAIRPYKIAITPLKVSTIQLFNVFDAIIINFMVKINEKKDSGLIMLDFVCGYGPIGD
jgi:hypothetical protein